MIHTKTTRKNEGVYYTYKKITRKNEGVYYTYKKISRDLNVGHGIISLIKL